MLIAVIAVLAVVTDPEKFVQVGLGKAETVTVVLARVTPCVGTEARETACVAGKFPMVTLFPTVTEEMLMGTVPLIDAVTVPICAVPATNAGSVVKETG